MTPKRNEEQMTNRSVLVFAWSALLVWMVTWLGSMMAKGGRTYFIIAIVCLFFAFASAISMIFGMVWYIIALARGKQPEGQVFNGGILILLSLMLLGGSSLLAKLGERGVGIFYIFLPLMGLVYLLWAVYSREVFVLYITLTPIILCLWFLYKLPPENPGQRLVWAAIGFGIALGVNALHLVFRGWLGVALPGEAMDRGRVALIYVISAMAVAAAWYFGTMVALASVIVLGLFLLVVLIGATIGLAGAGEGASVE